MQAFIAEVIPQGTLSSNNDMFMKIMFSGCDFKCPWCNTPELLETKFEHEMDLRDVKREIENNLGNIKGIFLTGGEPCFQKAALVDLLKKARELKLKTVLDTNGSKPEVIETLLKNTLVDTVIMDLKAPFNENFEKVTKSATFFKTSQDIIHDIGQTLQVLRAYDEKIEIIFRTTIIPGLMFRKEDLLKIGEEITDMRAVWELKAFSGNDVKKQMQNINSPTRAFLENLREIIMKEFPRLNVIVI
ncbi:MAG: radical SAM protein [archaeon]